MGIEITHRNIDRHQCTGPAQYGQSIQSLLRASGARLAVSASIDVYRAGRLLLCTVGSGFNISVTDAVQRFHSSLTLV
ncbi:hypothetical protein HW555_007526 [Spodoptera exigua]|uniref:Uncharacterized protein n=1 Tax=Spodoptera exigua TaxID=7107 RepID=A0A835GCS6_SPOEX|nr:hypothetical protein HW555_007526 [Spodoptera exigua]